MKIIPIIDKNNFTGMTEDSDGDKCWRLNGGLHREDGPAIEWSNGDKYWFLNDKRHREDGPSHEFADGRKLWYLNGEELTEVEHYKQTAYLRTSLGKLILKERHFKLEDI